ncbi:MAG: WHG domain-containing protein [Caldilineaceae bacterium]|nr:WHG domain-containing protein [Caldilineaceae bacterium]
MARQGLNRGQVIKQAAMMLDANVAVSSLTLTELAAELGIRTPSLYNHVQSLDDLHAGLALYGLTLLTGFIQEAITGKSGRAALEAAAHAYRRFARQHPGLYPLTLRAPDAGEVELERQAALLVQIFLLILASCGVQDEDGVHALRGLRALLHGFCSLEAAQGYKMPIDTNLSFDRALGAYLDGLLSG